MSLLSTHLCLLLGVSPDQVRHLLLILLHAVVVVLAVARPPAGLRLVLCRKTVKVSLAKYLLHGHFLKVTKDPRVSPRNIDYNTRKARAGK